MLTSYGSGRTEQRTMRFSRKAAEIFEEAAKDQGDVDYRGRG
jgi:hypothetical protein